MEITAAAESVHFSETIKKNFFLRIAEFFFAKIYIFLPEKFFCHLFILKMLVKCAEKKLKRGGILSKRRIIDLGSKEIDLREDDVPISLFYFGRVEVRDWEELFFIAVKCLYIEFPDVINRLCSKDPSRVLFLRTTTIDMKHPRRIAPIIFLETDRTPQEIIHALKTIFYCAGVVNVNMKIEVTQATTGDLVDLEKMFLPSVVNREQNFENKTSAAPSFTLDQSIEEMLAALDAMDSKNFSQQQNFQRTEKKAELEVPMFGSLFFHLNGRRYGPFMNEKSRYVELMKCLAEFFPEEMLKQAGRHINSTHRLTLMHGKSYLYFREPVMLPNDLFTDKGFSDNILIENEKYYLERCGLSFENVIRNA